MYVCTRCSTTASGFICPRCKQRTQEIVPQASPGGSTGSTLSPHHVAARGFGEIFGLHPALAMFTIAANLMIGGVDTLSGALAAITGLMSLPAALVFSAFMGFLVGLTTYLGQKRWYGDDPESARVKALIVGVLTAIPVALPGMLFGGIALMRSLFHRRH